MLEAGGIGLGASAGNAGWVTPSLSTPLAAPGVLRMGLRSALDPKGALVIRPQLDPLWIRWLWGFARSCRPAAFKTGVAASPRPLAADAGRARRHARGRRRVRGAPGRASLRRADPHPGSSGSTVSSASCARSASRAGSDPLDADAARALEPALGPDARLAIHTTVDRHVDPSSLTAGLGGPSGRGRGDGDDGVHRAGDPPQRRGWRVVGPDGRSRGRRRGRGRGGRRLDARCSRPTACERRSSAPRATRSPSRTPTPRRGCRSTSASRSSA